MQLKCSIAVFWINNYLESNGIVCFFCFFVCLFVFLFDLRVYLFNTGAVIIWYKEKKSL